MTEKEKAAAGLLYNANYDKELIADRIASQKKCKAYNAIDNEDTEKRREAIKNIVAQIGEGGYIEQPFYCDYGYNIKIGKNFYSNYNLVILDCALVTIGDNVFIGPDCGIYTAGHPINAQQRNEGLEYAYGITIGSNVWIGGGVRIMPGVTIGDNCVIGAGSVVTKDIPSGVIAVGNPCRVLREIDERDIITQQ
ncbi:MAG: sugar O-acetyltransferase [Clostridia bacterium]|nr:sugar O-acetyltransferase [Clostridia bacterium]